VITHAPTVYYTSSAVIASEAIRSSIALSEALTMPGPWRERQALRAHESFHTALRTFRHDARSLALYGPIAIAVEDRR
jgi:hypothetical protein